MHGADPPPHVLATRCAQVTPREADRFELSGFIQEKVLRLTKTNELSVAHTLDLKIIMRGTDVWPATWTIVPFWTDPVLAHSGSVPFWLSLPLTGAVGPRDPAQPLSDLSPFGNLSLTANCSGLPERLATPYQASLNLSVTSQHNASFLVRVKLYVSALTIARKTSGAGPLTPEFASPMP